jgi:hypothetical protein
MPVSTPSPPYYWTRSSSGHYVDSAMFVDVSSGNWRSDNNTFYYGFRPAGVFHLKALNVCLPQTFRLERVVEVDNLRRLC